MSQILHLILSEEKNKFYCFRFGTYHKHISVVCSISSPRDISRRIES